MNHDPARLFPDLQDWDDGRGISGETWVELYGSLHDAVLYSSILWPAFVEHRGCLLWEAHHDNFDDWFTSLGGDQTAVEKVMNHRHLTDFFLYSHEELTEERLDCFGALLRDMWLTKLRRDFPHLPVRVELLWQDRESFLDAQIVVYVER